MVTSFTYFSSTSVAPYSIILSIHTDGFVEFVKLFFCAQRSGKIIWVTPRSTMHLMPKTRVGSPLALFLTKASLRLPRSFPSYIYNVPSSFFSISFWLIWEREIVAFNSVNPAFTSVTLSTVTLKAFLQRIILTASFCFYFYFSSSYYLLVVE